MATDYKLLENTIRTRLQGVIPNSVTNTLEVKRISYSTEIVTEEPSFPHVYVHQIDTIESDAVLEGNEIINALVSFQIEVTSNRSKVDSRDIAYAIITQMKRLCFETTLMPLYTKTDGIHGFTMRFRRYVSPDDTL